MKVCKQLCPWNTLYGCKKPESEPCILSNMPCESFEQKPMTNADRIRSLSDEDLAKIIFEIAWDGECIHWTDAETWLKEPDNGWVGRVLKECDGDDGT